MKKLLWLDDLRCPYENKESKVPKGDWQITWVKNHEQFVNYFLSGNSPDANSFDNDLGEPLEGYDCLHWLKNFLLDNGATFVPEIFVHSTNPAGVINITTLAGNMKKFIY